ncbi:hypothetical protein BN7_276 [Wickerhamomyces ciferrii]|uniref:Uncharacterized protein n=1 Tax=Wickerhamomyces ciferrii (strain ATCC 14091 / BCRC 22168 / CBS 111 / JCM 3599 / NBRC 0793 / NRRL Y-1031 F-60-10) TaxID=1206466 RepID=K0KEV3_WICCF|nr:uncharacterized protein BN7_276 [Wickerhamomyces ciferrii]CCH40742.1 hypothetical protein BN7_276 [Wickerhamomyces ciferrii]
MKYNTGTEVLRFHSKCTRERVIFENFLLSYVRPTLKAYTYFKLLLIFPIQYYITTYMDSIYNYLSMNSTELIEYTRSLLPKDNSLTHPANLTFNKMGPLPAFIWEDVMVIGGADGKILTRLNSAFYREIGPRFYKIFGNIQALMVISSTNKMRKNDFNFLSFGPDFPHVPYEDFSIYKRNFIGSKYRYETLDVYSTKDYTNSEGNSDVIVVTSLSQIEFLFKTILNNPKSLLRKSIRNISFDLTILDGTEELLENKFIQNTIEELVSRSSNVTKLSYESPMMFVEKDHEDFLGCRWNTPYNSVLWSFAKFQKEFYEPANEIFPNNVYFGEFLPIAEQFDYIYSKKRLSLSDISNLNDFENENPMSTYANSMHELGYEQVIDIYYDGIDLNYKRMNEISTDKCHDIKIKNRDFISEKNLLNTLKFIMESMIDQNNTCGDSISTSFLINGFIETEYISVKDFETGYLNDFKTSMILINKPCKFN